MAFYVGVQTVRVHSVDMSVVRAVYRENLRMDVGVQHGNCPCAAGLSQTMDIVVQKKSLRIGPQLVRLYVPFAERGIAAMYGRKHQNPGLRKVFLYLGKQIVHSAAECGVVRVETSVKQGLLLAVLVGGLFLYRIDFSKGDVGVIVVCASENQYKVPCLSACLLFGPCLFHLSVHVLYGCAVACIASGLKQQRVAQNLPPASCGAHSRTVADRIADDGHFLTRPSVLCQGYSS